MSADIVRAFSADHVIKLTGLSKGQLHYWDETGFFCPRYAFENRRSPYSRIYSFKDVVGLRTLSILRKEYGISLQHLRKVADELSKYMDAPWSEVKLYVLGREVVFREPETQQLRGVVSRQFVTILLRSVKDDVEAKARKLKERSADQVGQVERRRYVVHNAWVVAGTRIPTKAISRFHQAGYSLDEIIREYPTLTRADVEAALAHEEDLAKQA
jgi:uncharacterized protein (DUF433 family)